MIDEVAKFDGLAPSWWDPKGPMAPLHAMNPTRLGVIERAIAARFGRDPKAPAPFCGLRALDIGCGAGLVSEPLARLGANVTGLDPAPRNVEVASAHAGAGGLVVDYRCGRIEDVPTTPGFDVVLGLEVVEHVEDPPAFVRETAMRVAAGGMLVLSTLNRTAASYAGAILAAEMLLGWLPRGTHDWRRFLRPHELAGMVRAAGLRPIEVTGLSWNGDTFRAGRDVSINYVLIATRD